VNAAFLLVTSALLVGQPAAGDKKPVAPLIVAPAPVASSCGQDPCGCEGYGHRLRDKLRGLFNRNSCDSCQPTTCQTHHVHAPICKSSCEETCKPKWFAHHTHASCAPATCNDSCERGGLNLLAKLRERFHRGDACCDGGCASGGCASGGCSGTTFVPAKTGEKIDTAPKKMPIDPPKDKKPQEVRIETQSAPFAPNVIQVTPTVPSVEITPVPSPRVEGDRRDPF
jgi:hypothetical protein